MDPFILTATLDAPTQAWLDDLRRRHFPPARNHLAAHVTLFHHLMQDPLAAARALAPDGPWDAEAGPPYSLGGGVAFRIECPPLVAFRRALAGRVGELTRQDAGWHRPHVTVQNKVTPETARALLETLDDDPRPCRVTGVALWVYRGGPWDAAGALSFGPPRA